MVQTKSNWYGCLEWRFGDLGSTGGTTMTVMGYQLPTWNTAAYSGLSNSVYEIMF